MFFFLFYEMLVLKSDHQRIVENFYIRIVSCACKVDYYFYYKIPKSIHNYRIQSHNYKIEKHALLILK
jgi:hypothetical protein